MRHPVCHVLLFTLTLAAFDCTHAQNDAPVVAPRRGSTRIIQPFNGKDLSGWVGHIGKHWFVEDGEDGPEIVGRNTDEVPVSTYLLTSVDFSEFRFTFEFKLAVSEMHSGVALWGNVAPEHGDEFTYAGHLVMFPSNYGIYDLYGRKLIHENADAAKAVGHQHDWNKVEVLAQGNRIRFALNGTLVSDWREPEPERIKEGPIGLQLHSNKQPQEVRFRNLKLETFPQDRLLTVEAADDVAVDLGPPELDVEPGAPEIWTKYTEAVIPRSLLQQVIHPEHGLMAMGFRQVDTIPLYGLLEKVRRLDIGTIRKAAAEFRKERQQVAFNGAYADSPAHEFKAIVDLFEDKKRDQNCPTYHGKLVTLRGHIRGRRWVPVRPEESPFELDGFHEVWLFDEHSQGNPVMVLCPDVDESLLDLPGGLDIQVDHCYATGYFFKFFGYEAQDSNRFAPVFVARKLYHREPKSSGNPFALNLSAQMQLAVAAVVLLLAGRYGLVLWKKSKSEEHERHALRQVVEDNQGEPTFDNITDTGGQLQLPPEMIQSANETSAETAADNGSSAEVSESSSEASADGSDNVTPAPEDTPDDSPQPSSEEEPATSSASQSVESEDRPTTDSTQVGSVDAWASGTTESDSESSEQSPEVDDPDS